MLLAEGERRTFRRDVKRIQTVVLSITYKVLIRWIVKKRLKTGASSNVLEYSSMKINVSKLEHGSQVTKKPV